MVKNEESCRIARELAKLTGDTMTGASTAARRERLERERRVRQPDAVHGEGDAELLQQRAPAGARPSAGLLGRAGRHSPLLLRIRTQKAGRRESMS